MPDYRLYVLDRHSGHIRRTAEIIHADDNAAAIRDVRRRGGAEALELWCGRRKVWQSAGGTA